MAGKVSKKLSLSRTLKNHQANVAAAERARTLQVQREAAAKRKSQPKAKAAANKAPSTYKGKQKEATLPIGFVVPFEDDDRILLVGEGNFSFTLALIQRHGIPACNVLATTVDSEEQCYAKYPDDAEIIVSQLRSLGARVLFGVDATTLHKHKEIRTASNGWNKVVFNFPHVGAGIKDQDRNVLTNQRMLLGFLRSAASFLSKGVRYRSRAPKVARENGSSEDEDEELYSTRSLGSELDYDISDDSEWDEWHGIVDEGSPLELPRQAAGPAPARQGVILITLRESKPYTLWDVPNLAKRPPQTTSTLQPRYTQVRSFRFWPEAYPGYEHRRTKGGGSGEKEEGMGGTGGVCRTWEFVLRDHSTEKSPKLHSN